MDGKIIIPLFDPPHLLKGIRNNFLDNRVKFSWKRNNQVGSWADIVQLYQMDKGDVMSRMCYKLTDSHIYANKMRKMKVSIAAQVPSHRVSSSIRWAIKHGMYMFVCIFVNEAQLCTT